MTKATGSLGYGEPNVRRWQAPVPLSYSPDATTQGPLRAIEGICEQFPNALIAYEHLDLASLSVADFTRRFAASNEQLDLLINNAA